MKLRMHNDYVRCRRLEKDEKSAGGIIITKREAQPGDMEKARVVGVGPGRVQRDGTLSLMSVKKGDIVLLPPFGTGLDNAKKRTHRLGEDERILRCEEILAVIEEE